jgi:hypothetical protein
MHLEFTPNVSSKLLLRLEEVVEENLGAASAE